MVLVMGSFCRYVSCIYRFIRFITDKNEIEGEEGVNEYKGIFFTFAF